MVSYNQQLSRIQGLLPPDTDWTYVKKREAQEIVPRVYLGPFGAGVNEQQMRELGITHSIIFRAPEEARIIKPKWDFIQYEVVECRDMAHECLIQHFSQVKTAIDHVLKTAPGSRMLLQGTVGMYHTRIISSTLGFFLLFMLERCVGIMFCLHDVTEWTCISATKIAIRKTCAVRLDKCLRV